MIAPPFASFLSGAKAAASRRSPKRFALDLTRKGATGAVTPLRRTPTPTRGSRRDRLPRWIDLLQVQRRIAEEDEGLPDIGILSSLTRLLHRIAERHWSGAAELSIQRAVHEELLIG